MFRWNDSDKYEKFLRSLPKGTKVTVHSHSYGVPTAMRGIKNTGVPVDTLYTGDPVSWTERVDEKPANVKSWKNFLPSTLNPSVGYNWVAHLGGRWGSRAGAENIEAVPVDGEEVGHGSYSKLLGDR